MSAGSLKTGLKVLLTSGLLASVSDLQAIDTFATVYNFEVEKTHTYYVGTEGVLVHNSCGLDALKQIKNVLSEAEWTTFQDLIINAKATTSERIVFYKELAKLDDPTLKTFFNDFKSGGLSFQTGVIKNIELIEIWKGIGYIANKDIPFLKAVRNFSGSYLETHIFTGHFSSNSVKGVHHASALTTKTTGFVAKDLRIRPGTLQTGQGGVMNGLLEVFDGTTWQLKTGNSGYTSLFPWNKQQTIEEIAYAISRPNPTFVGGNEYYMISNGVEIHPVLLSVQF